MKIMPISTQQNQQQDFQGRVSKKTIRRINSYAKRIINSEIKAANYCERGINEQLIKDTVATRDNFIKNLTSFAELLHPDSVVSLKLHETDKYTAYANNDPHYLEYFRLSVKNKKIATKEKLQEFSVFRSSWFGDKTLERAECIFRDINEFLKNFEFSGKNAKQIDTDMFTYLLNYFIQTKEALFSKPKRIAKKIDRFAEEFGYPKDCLKMLENGISNATYPGCLEYLEPSVKKVLQEERTNGILSAKPNEPVSLEKYLEILKLRSQKNKAKNKEIVESLKKDKIL